MKNDRYGCLYIQTNLEPRVTLPFCQRYSRLLQVLHIWGIITYYVLYFTYNGYVGHVCGHMIGGHTADKERK